MPLEEDKVDIVVSGLVLNFIPDKSQALKEMVRVVKPGGTSQPMSGTTRARCSSCVISGTGYPSYFRMTRQRTKASSFLIASRNHWLICSVSAGLKAIETTALDAPTVFSDFDDYWSPFLRGQGPAGAYCASLSEDQREQLREKP